MLSDAIRFDMDFSGHEEEMPVAPPTGIEPVTAP